MSVHNVLLQSRFLSGVYTVTRVFLYYLDGKGQHSIILENMV